MSTRVAEDLITQSEAAHLLGVTKPTVARWGRQGRLDEVRIAGTRWVRYSRAQILAYLNGEGAA